MVDIWIIAATSATLDRAGRNPDGVQPDSGDTEQERHSVEFLCLLFSAPRLFDPITVRGLLRLQAAVTSGSIALVIAFLGLQDAIAMAERSLV